MRRLARMRARNRNFDEVPNPIYGWGRIDIAAALGD